MQQKRTPAGFQVLAALRLELLLFDWSTRLSNYLFHYHEKLTYVVLVDAGSY